jgi:GNAT superfamily N-acetyltransferase
MIHSVTDENLSEVKAFLEKYRETALFLLSILETRGPSLTEDLNSGNYKCLKSPEGLQGVFCLTRRGNLLVQTEGDFTDEVLEACRKEELPIGGVLGEWETAHSLWEALLTRDSSLQTTYQNKTVLLSLPLSSQPRGPLLPDGILVRSLEPGDFEEWDPLMQAFAAEEGLPLDGTPDQRQKLFEAQASKGYVWGLFLDDRLLSTADYNARSGATAQVGGVFTQPLYRRRGLSRAVIKTLIVDSVRRHSVDLLILFTRDSRGPRKLYKSFGFEPIGHYGLLFGKRT